MIHLAEKLEDVGCFEYENTAVSLDDVALVPVEQAEIEAESELDVVDDIKSDTAADHQVKALITVVGKILDGVGISHLQLSCLN